LDASLSDLVLGVSRDDLGQGAFAGAIGSHDGMDLSSRDFEVETVEDLSAFLGDLGVEVAYAENGAVTHPVRLPFFVSLRGPLGASLSSAIENDSLFHIT
jgi:hypothetical protein